MNASLPPASRIRWTLCLLSLVLLESSLVAQVASHRKLHADPPFEFIDRAFTFDSPSFGTVPNGRTHAQDMVISHAGWQYMTYWDEDRRLAVARRRLPRGTWQVFAFEDYRILGQDAHNQTVIGVCPNDGTLHLAFDHHVDTLRYRKSVPGLANRPGNFLWDASAFGPVVDELDPQRGTVTRVTYPRFLTTPSGDLQFNYREYSSGDGRMRLVDYDGATGSWSEDRVFIERTGSHSDPLAGSSNTRNPYFNRLEYDDHGILQASWTWRERASTRYNRDIAYAYSEDGGRVWFNGQHQQIADTRVNLPITAQSVGVTAIPLGAEWGLMNDQGQVIDRRGRVHVVMYYKDVPDTVVSYGSIWNSHYYHYWLDADGVWRGSRLSTMGSRPKLFANDHGDLFLIYRTGLNLAVDRATPEADYLDWQTIRTVRGRFGSEIQGDVAWFQDSGRLTLGMQESPAQNGDITRLGVVNLDLSAGEDCPQRDVVCPVQITLDTERDTYVRGGSHALENYGQLPILAVRHALTEEDQRIAFLRFHLADLLNHGPLARARLRLHVAASGPQWATDNVEVRRCALDAWPEYTTNWNNRPLPDGPGSLGKGGGSFVDIDVTEAVMSELARGGSRITLQVAGVDPDVDRWVDFHSREAAPALRPILLVDQVNTVEPVADAHARSGIYATTNYGADDRLVVKEDPNLDFDRVAYLRFDLSPLKGTGTIERVYLIADSPGMSPLGQTTPYSAHFVADDSWGEGTLNWVNRPALGARLAVHYGRPDMRWDVTSEALAAWSGDGLLSLALSSQREGGQRALNLWSRETSNPNRRPRLLIRYAQAP